MSQDEELNFFSISFRLMPSGPWWEPSCVALRLWVKSWQRNAPSTRTWIPAKPNFTSTRRTFKHKQRGETAVGLSEDVLVGSFFKGLIGSVNEKPASDSSRVGSTAQSTQIRVKLSFLIIKPWPNLVSWASDSWSLLTVMFILLPILLLVPYGPDNGWGLQEGFNCYRVHKLRHFTVHKL